MEDQESITRMSKSLATFCNNLQSSSDALKNSLDRRPIPLGANIHLISPKHSFPAICVLMLTLDLIFLLLLGLRVSLSLPDSASTTFIQSLNRRVSALTADLNLLESMALGTVSVEELLGHCHQIFKQNQSGLAQLQSHLVSHGYLPSDDGYDEFDEDFMAQDIPTAEPESQSLMKSLEDNSLFDESLNLRSLGLSDICLATLASKGEGKSDVLDSPPKLRSLEAQHAQSVPKTVGGNAASLLESLAEKVFGGENEDETELHEASKSILVLERDYEDLPSYMKTLAPWEDLQSAVAKMNSFLSDKGKSKQTNNFHPEDLEAMGLGSKGRSYLLLLVRMKRLSVDTNEGLITYKVL